VPSHAETIQYAHLAVTACEATLGHVDAATSEFATVENYLRAAFEDTGELASFGQFHEQATTSIGGAGQALSQLISELSAALARFPG
jgi:hypothetical protein